MIRRTTTVALSAAAVVSLMIAACTEPTTPALPTPDDLATTAGTPAVTTASSPRPQLISCPTDETVSASRTIGLLGGTVTAGGTSISIPSGAVLFPSTFTVTVPRSGYMEVAITAHGREHYQFLLPVTVVIDYSRCADSALGDDPLSVYYIEDVTKSLLQQMFGGDDRGTRKFTFVTDHLSGYAIAN